MFFTAFACLVLILCAFLVLASLRFSRPTAALIAGALFCYAQIVMIGQVASLLRELNNPWFFFSCQLIFLGLAYAFWRRRGAPALITPFLPLRRFVWRGWIRGSLRRAPDLWALAATVALAYVVGGYLVLSVPPNSGDAMGTYMARVGQWVTRGTMAPWPTQNWAQISYPVNPQLQVLWTVIFWGGDQLGGAIQFVAALVGMAGVYGLARILSASRSQAVFAGLTWATLPQILLQSTSTQTDLVFTSLLISCVYLLYLGLKERLMNAIVVSGLAFGLAAGTKQILLLILPGMALGLVALWFSSARPVRGLLRWWGVACLSAFLLLGSYTYVQNMFVWGMPFGPSETSIANFQGRDRSDASNWLRTDAVMGSRFLYQAVDVTGLPERVAAPLHALKADAASRLFGFIHLPVQSKLAVMQYARSWGFDYRWRPLIHEHNAWFGPLVVLLLLPCLVFHAYDAARRWDPYRLTLILALASVLFWLSGFRSWGGTEARYFMPGLTLCWGLTFILFRAGRLFPLVFRAVIAITAIAVMTNTVLNNNLKPLVGPNAIWRLERRDRQMLYFPRLAPTVHMVDSLVPASARIGYINFEVPEYLLFGPSLTRSVIPVFPERRAKDKSWLEKQDLDAILCCSQTLGGDDIPGYVAAGASEGYWDFPCHLVLRAYPECTPLGSDQARAALLGSLAAPADAPLLTVDPRLKGQVGIGPEILTPTWGLERSAENRSFLWLGGEGKDGLHTAIWSDSARIAMLTAEVAPGPARADDRRTLRFSLAGGGDPQVMERSFEGVSQIHMVVVLARGRNALDVEALDTPTVRSVTDRRLLLVRLLNLEVAPCAGTLAGPQERPLVLLDQSLVPSVLLYPELQTPGWPVESDAEHSWLWLGSGKDRGLGGTLRASEEVSVSFEFNMRPGPARNDSTRTLEFLLQSESGAVQRQTKRMTAPSVVTFAAKLLKGETTFRLHVLEPATRTIRSDKRPLMACIMGVWLTLGSASDTASEPARRP